MREIDLLIICVMVALRSPNPLSGTSCTIHGKHLDLSLGTGTEF